MTQVNTSQSEPCKAHHEAGHAVIADSLGYKVHLVTIVADGPTYTQGRTEYDDPLEKQHERRLSTLSPFALRVVLPEESSLFDDDVRLKFEKVE
jgi:hypothetical protein